MCAAGSLRRCRQGAFRGLALTSRHSGARVSPRGTRSSGLRSGATTLHFARADRHLSQRLYGWSGPWATRRGFDSLVQMSAGIAETGMHWRQSNKPVPLPVQALESCNWPFLWRRRRSGRIQSDWTKDEKAAHRQLQRASFLAIANATARA